MLEGLDKNWSILTDRTEIAYNNLSYGAYIFRVKALNSEGYWGSELNYPFSIRPPWWLSTWAYIFYGFCFILGIFLTDRYQRKRILQKERALSREREFEQPKKSKKHTTNWNSHMKISRPHKPNSFNQKRWRVLVN
jgi:hypothetical protein